MDPILYLLVGKHFNGDGFGGALLGTQGAGDALDWLNIIGVIVHARVWAEANAGQAANTFLLFKAHNAGLVTLEGTRGADLNAVTTLGADNHAPLCVAETGDTDGRLGRIDLFVPGLGANVLTEMATDA